MIANDSDFKQAYKFCKFYPIKQTCFIARIPYLAYTFNYSGQTQLHISKSVCAVFHWNQTLKVFVNCRK